MKVDRDTLHKIAHLARIKVNPAQEEAYINNLSEILDWVEKLNEVDTDGVEPLTHMTMETNMWREDETKEHLSHEKGLALAPKKDSDYFRVPKVK